MDDTVRTWNPYPAERTRAEVAPHITRDLIERATRDFLKGGGCIQQLTDAPDRIKAARYEANRETGGMADPLVSLEERDDL